MPRTPRGPLRRWLEKPVDPRDALTSSEKANATELAAEIVAARVGENEAIFDEYALRPSTSADLDAFAFGRGWTVDPDLPDAEKRGKIQALTKQAAEDQKAEAHRLQVEANHRAAMWAFTDSSLRLPDLYQHPGFVAEEGWPVFYWRSLELTGYVRGWDDLEIIQRAGVPRERILAAYVERLPGPGGVPAFDSAPRSEWSGTQTLREFLTEAGVALPGEPAPNPNECAPDA